MIVLLKLLIYPFVFLLFIMAFFPSKQLYYYLQHSLYDKFTITIKDKQISSIPLKFDIDNVEIGLGGERIATLSTVSLHTYLFKNSFIVSNIHIDDAIAPPYLKGLENIHVSYSLFKPLDIDIRVKSPIFVKGHIHFDIKNLSVKFFMYARAQKTHEIENIIKLFKVQKRGVYVYEYKL